MERRNLDLNIWPCVADMFLAALMVMAVVWLSQTLYWLCKLSENKADTQGTVISIDQFDAKKVELEAALKQLRKQEDEQNLLAEKLQQEKSESRRLAEALANAEATIKKGVADHAQPPVFTLPDSEYRFDPGKAELTPQAEKDLRNLLDGERFRKAVNHPRVNTIAIVGHTDGVPVDGNSTLDTTLGGAVAGHAPLASVRPGSNADLGLLRAFRIRKVIETWLLENEIKKSLHLRCYSAAQTAPPNDDISDWRTAVGEDGKRRRVEIFFLGVEEEPKDILIKQ